MLLILLILFCLSIFAFPVLSFAAWTPLIAATDFDGIKSDVLTSSGGILCVLLIIVGIGLLVKVIGR